MKLYTLILACIASSASATNVSCSDIKQAFNDMECCGASDPSAVVAPTWESLRPRTLTANMMRWNPGYYSVMVFHQTLGMAVYDHTGAEVQTVTLPFGGASVDARDAFAYQNKAWFDYSATLTFHKGMIEHMGYHFVYVWDVYDPPNHDGVLNPATYMWDMPQPPRPSPPLLPSNQKGGYAIAQDSNPIAVHTNYALYSNLTDAIKEFELRMGLNIEMEYWAGASLIADWTVDGTSLCHYVDAHATSTFDPWTTSPNLSWNVVYGSAPITESLWWLSFSDTTASWGTTGTQYQNANYHVVADRITVIASGETPSMLVVADTHADCDTRSMTGSCGYENGGCNVWRLDSFALQ
jgi:hypothetical protein